MINSYNYNEDNSNITSQVINEMYNKRNPNASEQEKNNNPLCKDGEDRNVASYVASNGQEYIGVRMDSNKNANEIAEEIEEYFGRANVDGIRQGNKNIRLNANMESMSNGANPIGYLMSNIKDAIEFRQRINFPIYTKYALKDGKIVEEEMSVSEFAKKELVNHECKSSAYLSAIPIKDFGNTNQGITREQMNLDNEKAINGGLGETKNFEDGRVDWYFANVIRDFELRMRNAALEAVRRNNPQFFPDVNTLAFNELARYYGAREVFRIENGSNLSCEVDETEDKITIQDCPVDGSGKKNGNLIEKVITKKFNKSTTTNGKNFTGLLNGNFLTEDETIQEEIFGKKSLYNYTASDIINCAKKIATNLTNRVFTTNIPMDNPCVMITNSLANCWKNSVNQEYYLNNFPQGTTFLDIFIKTLNGSYSSSGKIIVVAVPEQSNFGAFLGNGMNDASFINNFSPLNARSCCIKTTPYTDDVAGTPTITPKFYESKYGIAVVDLSMIVNPDLGGAQLWVSKNALFTNAQLMSLGKGNMIDGNIPESEYVKQSPLVSTMSIFYPYASLVYNPSQVIGYKFTFDYIDNNGEIRLS